MYELPDNTKMYKNLTTNVLIYIIFISFFFPPSSSSSYAALCLGGLSIKTQHAMMIVGVVTQVLTHLGWYFTLFLPIYSFSLRRHFFLFPRSRISYSVFGRWWATPKNRGRNTPGVVTARLDTLGIRWY